MHSKGKTEQGFTLAELLVTMGIVLLVMAAAYQGYTRLLQGFEMESTSAEVQMESMVNFNLLRQDILHSGYGLARNFDNKPLEWEGDIADPDDKQLTIRSTINALKQETRQWGLCRNETMNPELDLDSDYRYVILDQAKNYQAEKDDCLGPSDPEFNEEDLYFAYPYDQGDHDGCNDQFCYEKRYELRQSGSLDECASGTYNLQLSTDGGDEWNTVVSCVADWQLTFEIDEIGGDVVEDFSGEFDDAADIRNRLKIVHVYLLVQEGGYQRDFSFDGETSLNYLDESLSLEDVSDSSHYRWNMISFSVNPKDL